MYGEYEGSHGSFPAEYVQPIVGLRATKEAIEVNNIIKFTLFICLLSREREQWHLARKQL